MVTNQGQDAAHSAPSFWHSARYAIWRVIWRLTGWQTEGTAPESPKYVLVVAPHTSNWDFFVGFVASRVLGIKDPHWIGKAALFRWPLNYLAYPLGGIPVTRSHSHSFVDQVVAMYNAHDEFVVAIAPEGTRRKTDYWKSGFYYIALGAQAPITLVYLDFARKVVGISPSFMPTGDINADFALINEFYAPIRGLYANSQGEIRLRPYESAPSHSNKEPDA